MSAAESYEPMKPIQLELIGVRDEAKKAIEAVRVVSRIKAANLHRLPAIESANGLRRWVTAYDMTATEMAREGYYEASAKCVEVVEAILELAEELLQWAIGEAELGRCPAAEKGSK